MEGSEAVVCARAILGAMLIVSELGVGKRVEHLQLMLGYLVSSKTLNGIPNKWPGRYPRINRLRPALRRHPALLNLIHFNTDNRMRLAADLIRLHELAGPDLHGFQLNIAWPSIGDLEMYREAMGPEPRLVLQIGARAMRELGDSPLRVAEMTGHYVSLVDDILIDASGGSGEPFVIETGRAYLRAIAERGWNIGLGIAGGLSSKNVKEQLGPLLEEFPLLSNDAEGRLRTKPEDTLDLFETASYIAKSVEARLPAGMKVE
ncbi:hypothetical protein HYV30_03240 [Candidatus Kaiserbacteria bacterium]|nr:hypothetical protein [Candidatus Kaiserbacteria bacterium]